jgi:hypothetical protein
MERVIGVILALGTFTNVCTYDSIADIKHRLLKLEIEMEKIKKEAENKQTTIRAKL